MQFNQTRDSYYDEKYRNNYTNYGQYNVKDTYMSQIQNYLNEFTLKGYSTEYENFFAALNQLDLTPLIHQQRTSLSIMQRA